MNSTEARKAQMRRYYHSHREERSAYCRAHSEERAAYRANRREEMAAYHASYHADVIKPQLEDRRAFLNIAKRGVGCKDCGATDMLDFHHRDKSAKKYRISGMLGKPWCEIMDEIFKCDVLCRSCHTKRHWAEDKLLVV